MSEDYSRYDDVDFEELVQLIWDNIFQNKDNKGLWDYLRTEENIGDTADALAEIHKKMLGVIYRKSQKGEDTKGSRIFIQEVQNRQTGTNKIIARRKQEADRAGLIEEIARLKALLDGAGISY